jgi:hypothetical protein
MNTPQLNKLYSGIPRLKIYKNEIMAIAKNKNQKNQLLSFFIKYYMASQKDTQYGVFPIGNIFDDQFKLDLQFSNKYNNTNFNIEIVMETVDHIGIQYITDYNNFINNITLSPPFKINPKLSLVKHSYTRLHGLYRGIPEEFTQYLHCVNSSGNIIEMTDTIHLSMPPIFHGVELFGSCINTHNRDFCSVFEIERIFGSLGSFWDYNFHMDNLYLCNPPFDEILIERMSMKLISDLKETQYNVVVVVSIPVWDIKSQRSIKLKEYNMPFSGYEKLIGSDYLMEKVILNKDDYKYWNYVTGKSVASSYTHLIVLSNLGYNMYKKTFNLYNFTEMWRQFSLRN